MSSVKKVDNAVILAAGTSSRFAPLSYERPKALIRVKGEILIERQIRQLLDAGISDIILVTGYRSDMFRYLTDKYGVRQVRNDSYLTRNNNGSIYAAREFLCRSYVCSADNYFAENPFEREAEEAFYAGVYSDGETGEWCMETDPQGYIRKISIGGRDSWYMLGHTFWDEEFSRNFVNILEREYDRPETAGKLWEGIYAEHPNELHMKLKKYRDGIIYEFDTLDELREFDSSFREDPQSDILQEISRKLEVNVSEMHGFRAWKTENNEAEGVEFSTGDRQYRYIYGTKQLETIG